MKQKKRIIFLIILAVLSINTQFSKNKNTPQKNTQKRCCPLKKLGNIAYFFGSIAGATLIGYYIYKYTNEKKFLLEKTNQQKTEIKNTDENKSTINDKKSTLISQESAIVASTLTPINQTNTNQIQKKDITLIPINKEMNNGTTIQESELKTKKETINQFLENTFNDFKKSLNEEVKINPPFNEEELFPKMEELSIF